MLLCIFCQALFRHVQWNSQSIFVIRVYIEPSNQDKTRAHTTNLLDDSKLAAWTLVPMTTPNDGGSRQGECDYLDDDGHDDDGNSDDDSDDDK